MRTAPFYNKEHIPCYYILKTIPQPSAKSPPRERTLWAKGCCVALSIVPIYLYDVAKIVFSFHIAQRLLQIFD